MGRVLVMQLIKNTQFDNLSAATCASFPSSLVGADVGELAGIWQNEGLLLECDLSSRIDDSDIVDRFYLTCCFK